jgi:hypothetical protein
LGYDSLKIVFNPDEEDANKGFFVSNARDGLGAFVLARKKEPSEKIGGDGEPSQEASFEGFESGEAAISYAE